jgi:hypothetical protein
MNTFLIIIAVAAGGWALLIFGLKGMAALLRRSAVKAIRHILAGENILRLTENVSFLGADFPGPNLPPRTSGVLAITDNRIIFLPWFPRRAITLPRDTIAGVSLKDHHGTMAYNIPLLSLQVSGVGDSHGEMVWLAHEPKEWEKVVKSIL